MRGYASGLANAPVFMHTKVVDWQPLIKPNSRKTAEAPLSFPKRLSTVMSSRNAHLNLHKDEGDLIKLPQREPEQLTPFEVFNESDC